MKIHYFEQASADGDDMQLEMAKQQGYVAQNCLLGGETVMGLIRAGQQPCEGCACDRAKCGSKK